MVCKQGRGMWLDTVLGLGAGGGVDIVLAHFSHSFRNVVKLLKTFNLFSETENLVYLICMYYSSPILLICMYYSSPILLICKYYSSPILLICKYYSSPILLKCMYYSSPILFQFRFTTRTIVNTSLYKTTRFDLVYCSKFSIFSHESSELYNFLFYDY